MSKFELKPNQAAIILAVSTEGEVTVEAAFPEEVDDAGNLAVSICTVIGQKLSEDETFQSEVMKAVSNMGE